MNDGASDLVHPALLRWARDHDWQRFTSVQERSFRSIGSETADLIIGGSTASGKTEAALLPLITAAERRRGGVSVLSISPTKSLINDQYRRLSAMVQKIDVPIWKWHGEAPENRKKALVRDPRGIVLMTPESLEGRFIRQPLLVRRLFGSLDALLIDELHYFLSGPRGHQLASLIARLDHLALEPLRKIGMSATLGDLDYARKWLSPPSPSEVRIIDEPPTKVPFRFSIRGYEAPVSEKFQTGRRRLQSLQRASLQAVGAVLFETHRRGTHLVFAGSKRTAEMLCADLKSRAAAAGAADRFSVHHGSMGKKERERLEQDLRDGVPSTVVTTRTLESGVDIGSVECVEHLGAPASLSAFRQRIGRSGRRGTPGMARIHVTEEPIQPTTGLLDRLRLNTVRAIAALDLLEKRFVEPPDPDGTMLSVVLQQTLSYVHQKGGARRSDLGMLIRSVTPFERLSNQSYDELLAGLCDPAIGLLDASLDGKYRLSARGEKLLESNEIYAVFQTTVEWDVWSTGEWVGSLARSMPIAPGDQFRLGGKAWKVLAVDDTRHRVNVAPSSSGSAPFFNISGSDDVHPTVAAEMRRILTEDTIPAECDPVSSEFLREGRSCFREAGLSGRSLVADEQQEVCHLFTWRGTRFNSLLAVLLRYKRFACDHNEVAVSVACADISQLVDALRDDVPSADQLSGFVESLQSGKFDKWIPEQLLREDWAKRHRDLERELADLCSRLR